MSELRMVKIGDYCSALKGKIGIKKAVPGKYPLVTTAEERSSHIEYHFDKPSVIIPLVSSTGHGHASLKRIHYQEGKFAVGSILCAVTPKNENILDARFLYHYLDVYKENLLVSLMQGMANVTLSIDKIKEIQFPLLPIEKQVEWIRLFEKAVSFTDGLLTETTRQQTLLRKLRQSILQDAISGKLTEQWRKDNPDVEPASELLKRIKEEKARLVKEKKIPKQKLLMPITEYEIPFELPKGWVWCRLGELVQTFQNGLSKRTGLNGKKGVVLRLSDIKNYRVDLSDTRQILLTDNEFKKYSLAKHDILITRVNGSVEIVGNFNYVDAEDGLTYCDHFIRMRLFKADDISQYIEKIEKCPIIREAIKSQFKTTSGQKTINQSHISNFYIPLPPTKEIKEIINKLNWLYKTCDQLESQITKSRQDSELLMQAVLKEAFEG